MSDTLIINALPVSALISDKVEQPRSDNQPRDRRRKSDRHARKLTASLECSGRRMPVQCRDISFGGAKLFSPLRARPSVGDLATLTIRVGDRVYRDVCRIVACQMAPDGSIIRLAFVERVE